MQQQLCRFTHCAYKQQEREQVRCRPISPQEADCLLGQCWHVGEDIFELHAVCKQVQPRDTKDKSKVPYTVDDESLHRRSIGGRFAEIEVDQQVRRNAHAFPAKEHLNKVVGGNQHQHCESKERQIRKEARFVVFALFKVLIMGHVAE